MPIKIKITRCSPHGSIPDLLQFIEYKVNQLGYTRAKLYLYTHHRIDIDIPYNYLMKNKLVRLK